MEKNRKRSREAAAPPIRTTFELYAQHTSKRRPHPMGGVFSLACLTRYGIVLNGSFVRKRFRNGAFRPVCELRSNPHASVRKTKDPRWGSFVLACLTRFERAAFRVGADQTGYSKMQINKGIRRFLGFFPSIVFVTYIPKPSSIVHSSHRCVVEMW